MSTLIQKGHKVKSVIQIASALIFLTFAVLYTISPVDFIPDMTPIIGTWDDFTLSMPAVFAATKFLKAAFAEEIDFSKWEKRFVVFSGAWSGILGSFDSIIPFVGSVDDLAMMLLVLVPTLLHIAKKWKTSRRNRALT